MMNCWKSFNINRDLGSSRVMIFSLLGMLTYFVLFYILFTDIYQIQDTAIANPIIFLAGMFAVLPVHKFLHSLPVWLSGKKARVYFEKSGMFLPLIRFVILGPVKRRLAILVMAFPVIVFTALMMTLTILFPSEIHYFSTMGALNFGFSVMDLIYLAYIMKAPAEAYVEDDTDGCKILIKQTF